MSPIRRTGGAALLWLAGVALYGSVQTALNVFDDYKDSPDSAYLFFAGISLGIAAALAVAGAWILRDRAITASERRRHKLGASLLVLSGAALPAYAFLSSEITPIYKDPATVAPNAAGAALALTVGVVALSWGAWQLYAGDRSSKPPWWITAPALAVVVAGVSIVYLVLPPSDAERLSGAAALAEHRAVGCSEQDGGWFYCRAQGPKNGTKDYVVTFDGECWVTMTPKVRDGKIVSLEEIHDGCLNRRGVGRTRPGPGEAPGAIADAASRFLPVGAR